MMARIPVRFNRIAAAFNEAAMAQPVRLCESSGSDHSPEDLTDLSDLVNSFIESNCGVENDEGKIEQEKENENDGTEAIWSDSETKDMLRRLMVNNICDGNEDDEVKQKILLQTKLACGSIGDMSSVGFKRQLMSRLRDKGFDAEFEIARPTTNYTSLIDVFPRIFVGKPEELKQIVGLMCRAMRESMKSKGMKVPPWRQNRYVQAKWFAQYKRTTNEISAKKASQKNDAVTTTRSVGFETLPTVSYYCRDNIATKGGLKVGYLHAAFNSSASVGLQS
ncbi:Uncharacterized protein TCM_012428 isoform 2 [Theobroma cacao]|uniref:Uncharacterized protein isoform 2 n=1 Tax=Theobroma cacao TaxID=3641 RepID=A0A061FVI3_THECC|nr:Uncharacterized protein TCM_012428 isoform 2 [Theobroma cacao]